MQFHFVWGNYRWIGYLLCQHDIQHSGLCNKCNSSHTKTLKLTTLKQEGNISLFHLLVLVYLMLALFFFAGGLSTLDMRILFSNILIPQNRFIWILPCTSISSSMECYPINSQEDTQLLFKHKFKSQFIDTTHNFFAIVYSCRPMFIYLYRSSELGALHPVVIVILHFQGPLPAQVTSILVCYYSMCFGCFEWIKKYNKTCITLKLNPRSDSKFGHLIFCLYLLNMSEK